MMAIQSVPDASELKRKGMAEAAKLFEGYMVEMMVREMRKTIPEGMFHNNAVELFSGVYDQELSKRIAEAGGFGFGSLLMDNIRPSSASPAHVRPIRMIQPSASHSRAVDGPLPVDGVVTSGFGRRSDPFHGKHSFHKGLDISAPSGTPIQPIRPGTVVSAGPRGGYGNVVVLDHGGGTTSMYAHCKALKVQAGQRVELGQIIATVGSTGRSTGPHLHLEVHQDGQAVDPVEALGWDSENSPRVVNR
jgi:murein DD-endopeptidase MepM/ murein hydrolase activator NlpD